MNNKPKLLLFLEGNFDIRVIIGLQSHFDMTLIGPTKNLGINQGIKERLEEAKTPVNLIEVDGGRLLYQIRSFFTLLKASKKHDLILSQESLRGSLNSSLVKILTNRPVITYNGIPPLEYFRCRYTRGQIGLIKWLFGATLIKTLLTINGLIIRKALAGGPYLIRYFEKYFSYVGSMQYYGVDTELYRPVDQDKKSSLKEKYGFSKDSFIIFFSSRVSHEKDPETVLQAVYNLYLKLKKEGRGITLLNLSGGYEKMTALAKELGLKESEAWLQTRPPAHPMKDLPEFYQLSDLVVQASREEGLGISPLEGMACGKPVIASNIGGMKEHLAPYCKMVTPLNVEELQKAIEATMNSESDIEALKESRAYIEKSWSKEVAINALSQELKKLLS